MMSKFTKIQSDHLQKLCENCSLVNALSELIWNAIDAEADEIAINFTSSRTAVKISTIEIRDNGHGILFRDAEDLFCRIGNSRSCHETSKNNKRIMHGTKGIGRLFALRLGKRATWNVRFNEYGAIKSYNVSMLSKSFDEVEFSDLTIESIDQGCGVCVVISDLVQDIESLRSVDSLWELARLYSLYLRNSTPLEITVDGTSIFKKFTPKSVESYQLPNIKENGKDYSVSLEIIEWYNPDAGKLYLCDKDGFPLDNIILGIQSNGYNFTAYLKTNYFLKYRAENSQKITNTNSRVIETIEHAKEKIRNLIRARNSEGTNGIIRKWKSEGVYPFKHDSDLTEVELVEKQVFDTIAPQINSSFSVLEDQNEERKKLQLELIRYTVENTPSKLTKNLYELLNLSNEDHDFLTSICEESSLLQLLQASKEITDRLKFLDGLKTILFDEKIKRKLKELSHLHQIVAQNAWIFGEKYELAVNNGSLTRVLKYHANKLGREVSIDEPVLLQDNKRGVIDLMFSRSTQMCGSLEHDHLIVELKRPTKKLDDKSIAQIQQYAFAVAEEEEFNHPNTNWVFWVISNRMDDLVKKIVQQNNRPSGLLHESSDQRIRIWVKTWGQVIHECNTSMMFLREKLNYYPDQETIMTHMIENYGEFLPDLSSLIDCS